jgi:AcrR family transcriptional regulator
MRPDMPAMSSHGRQTDAARPDATDGRSRGSGRLHPDAIVDACIALADREGLDAVTLRRLGADLGVDPTAMYRHFRNKEQLLTAVADRLLGRVLDGFRRSGRWRRDVRDVSLRARRVYLTHPALAPVLATAPAPLTNNQRIAEIVLGALADAGIDARRAALAYQVLENYTAGASSLDAQVGADVDLAWRTSFAMLPATEFPHAVEAAPHLYLDDEAAFRFGLELILDSLEALVTRPTARSGGSA